MEEEKEKSSFPKGICKRDRMWGRWKPAWVMVKAEGLMVMAGRRLEDRVSKLEVLSGWLVDWLVVGWSWTLIHVVKCDLW